MTKKPKTRKAPAAKASASKTAPAAVEPKRDVSEIRTLISRWRWLDADQAYQADCAATAEEGERLIAIHFDEQEEIESQLATLVPESFDDSRCLLGFVLENAEGRMLEGADKECMLEGTDIDMLTNIKDSLWAIWHDGIDKAREETAAETKAQMRDNYRFAIEITEKTDEREAARKAERETA